MTLLTSQFSDLTDPKRLSVFWWCLWVGVLLGLISLFGMAVDDRQIEGGSVWAKPIKFSVSLTLHLVTILWLSRLVNANDFNNRQVGIILNASGIASVLELSYIVLQSARGRDSHFNFDTLFETFMYYGFMGGLATLLMVLTIWLSVLIFKTPSISRHSGLYVGAITGLFLGSIATLFTAFAMASGEVTDTKRWIGGSLTASDGIPLLGWSSTGGDLRVAHFFGTHMMQVLPIVGFVADKISFQWPRMAVSIAAVAMVLLTAFTFLQALNADAFIVF